MWLESHLVQDIMQSVYDALVASLGKEGDALSQVYGIDIPGKQQTVFVLE